ncbi:MAG: bifunctional DNA primase/polymerase [Chloroflexi bacterium]|nr:bifunctional DNA primase/polymerase [Chloroflexota bacterium]
MPVSFSNSTNLRLQSALAHARRDRSILPVYWAVDGHCACGSNDCASPAKHPIPALAPRGVKHATTSTVVIRAWWTHAPFANPAIATGDASQLVVIDVDGDKSGYHSLADLEHEHGPLPHTVRVLTSSGEHIYFWFPGTHLKNTAGKLGPGLDVRCCGGYVLAVGAIHRSGRAYAWKEGHRPSQAPLARPPDWLYSAPFPRTTGSNPKGYAEAALASEEQQLLSTAEGQRNQRLDLAAFRLARFVNTGALTQSEIEYVLFEAARKLGLSDREAGATIASGLRAGSNR